MQLPRLLVNEARNSARAASCSIRGTQKGDQRLDTSPALILAWGGGSPIPTEAHCPPLRYVNFQQISLHSLTRGSIQTKPVAGARRSTSSFPSRSHYTHSHPSSRRHNTVSHSIIRRVNPKEALGVGGAWRPPLLYPNSCSPSPIPKEALPSCTQYFASLQVPR